MNERDVQPPSGGANALLQEAHQHRISGRYDAAISMYSRALDVGLPPPYEAGTRSNLGQCYLGQEKVVDAVNQFLRVLQIDSQVPSTAYDAAVRLAIIYRELHMDSDCLAASLVAKDALSRMDSVLASDAADRIAALVRRLYG